MPTKDYNIQPYYDDFDETKGYHRVLFKPNFAVQARELTQSQTILQDQIQKHSNFENGESMSSGQLNVYTNIAYISLSTDLSTNETATSIVGKVITNITSLGGVTAKIIAVAPKDGAALESLTVYIAYLDNTSTNSAFASGDDLYEVTSGSSISSTAWKTIGKITGYTTPTSNVGTGSIAQVESGIYYINGFATYVPKQTIILDKYTNSPSYKIGFDVSETTVTSSDDTSLNDNSVTSTNYQAPGADRHKIQLTLAKRSLTVSSTEGFVEVCEVVNGVVNKKKEFDNTQEKVVVSGLDYELRENLSTMTDVNGIAGTDSGGSGNKFSFGVSAGIGKIDGKEVRLKEKTYLAIDKARVSVTKSSTVVNSGAELGNYVVTDGVFKETANTLTGVRTVLNFAPASGDIYPLVWFASTTNATNELIGKARIRGIDRSGLDFKVYLFDIEIDSGKTLADASELHVWGSNTDTYTANNKLCDLQTEKSSSIVQLHGEDVTPSTLRETNKNALLHEMPYKGISRITGAVTISSIRRTYQANSTNTSTITLSPDGFTFASDTSNVIVYGQRSGSGNPNITFSSSDLTITGGGTGTLTITHNSSSFVASTSYTIVASIKPDSNVNSTRDLSQQYDPFTTKAKVERTVLPLTRTNAHPYSWKVFMGADFATNGTVSAGTDITSRYTMDTGQREDYIDFASLKLKDNQAFPTGRITVIYWHYPAGAGTYSNAQSYPVGNTAPTSSGGSYGDLPFVSNADGGTTYSLSDVPIYTSPISGKKFRLNECVDLRPVKGTADGNSAFNGSGANSMVVPDSATISQTGIVQFLGRIDKVYLGSDGALRVKSGVASMNPTIPDDPSDGIPLYNVKLLPYTYDLHDIVVQPLFDDGQRDTDFDAISSLEKSAKDYPLDVGRVRRNTFSDPFVGHGFANVTDDEFSASVDLQKGELRPKYVTESVPFATYSREGHGIPSFNTTLTVGSMGGDAKNVVTLAHTHLAEIQNLNSNSERALRNTDAITYNGVVYVKEWDVYKSVKSRPMIKNRTGDFDSIPYVEDGYNAQGTIWNEWETEWYGVIDQHIPEPKLDMSYNELDKSPNYYNVLGKEVGGKRVEGNYTPYIRSKTITINAYGLKPNCAITSVKFDGVEIISSLTPSTSPMVTDNNGKFSKTYIIPNSDEGVGTSKFTTGSKKIVISGNDNYAEGYYHAVGLFEDEGFLTKPYDLSWDEQTNETMFQEFEVFDETFITKLDLYFTAEDLFDRSVTVQIRKMENGKPSNKVLPYSIVSKVPSDFAATSTGTQVTFTFDETIYLKRGRYAIAIVTPSVEYKVQSLKVEQSKGSKGTGVGDLFIGSQRITDEILKFSLYRAKFTATQDDAIIASSFGNPLLNPNPIKVQTHTSDSIATIIVEHEGHGFTDGESVQLSGIKGKNEHDVLVTGTPNFTLGELVYASGSALTGADMYTVPYGYVVDQNTTNNTLSIATESGVFGTGDVVRSSLSSSTVTIGSNSNDVQTVKRLKGVHLGAGNSLAIVSGNAGTGYTSTTDDNGVATTNVSGSGGGTGSGTGLRVKVTASGGVVQSATVIFGGYGYETGDIVAVTGGGGNARLTVTAKGLTVGSHTILSDSNLTADSYAIGGANLRARGSTGYADGENTVTVKNTKRRVDMIRYNAKQFIPDGTSLSWEESSTVSLPSTDSIDVNTNIFYTEPRYLAQNDYNSVLRLTMSGDSSNDRVSPVFDISSANSLILSNSLRKSNYISRNLELVESANSVYVALDALLSKGNSLNVYAKTMESSTKNTFDNEIADTLVSGITVSETALNFTNNTAFSANDVIAIGEEQMLITAINGATSISSSTAGSGYTNGNSQTLTTTGGTGTGATVLVNIASNAIVGTPTIVSVGSGYTTGDVLNIQDASSSTNNGTITITSRNVVTRGHNQTQAIAHYANDVITKQAVSWNQLSQVGTTFDADFPDYKKMVYSVDGISDFSVLQLKINMTASNYAMPPKIKNLRIIPNYKDDSLKPLQTKTLISTKTGITNTSYTEASSEQIPTDFVVEEATIFITEVKLNSGVVTEYVPFSTAQVEVQMENGKVKPLETTTNTGCTVRFKVSNATSRDVTAVVIITGRRL